MTTATAETGSRVSLAHDTDDLAATYDRVGFRQFEHGKQLVALLQLQPGQRVLDVGCGTGLLGAWVADQLGSEGEVVGVDPLPLRVVLAARKHLRFHTQVGRAEDLSAFPDASFDAVYLNSVFHWVPDQPRALAEALRVVKPGGRIALNSADPQRPHDANLLLRQALDDTGLAGVVQAAVAHHHRVDADRLGALLAQAGFGGIEVATHTFYDQLQDVDELIAWSRSSSFGNWLSDLDPGQRDQVRARLAERLEPLRQGDSLTLKRHLVFASARRPVSPP
jgi:ubiquinone/menaquinone biosynthesis C-methylase UbiE